MATDSLAPQYCKRIKTKHGETAGDIPSTPTPINFIDDLSDDLLVAILVRLPDCRSAIRCSTVSKRWNFLISGPQLIHGFVHHRLANSYFSPYTFIFQTGGLNKFVFPAEYDSQFAQLFSEKSKILHGKAWPSILESSDYLNFLPRPMFVTASFNDLLLLSPASQSRNYFICDPLTRKWLQLPLAPSHGVAPSVVGLACNYQIGSIYNADYSYRLVRFYYSVSRRSTDENVQIKASIFSSEAQIWSKLVVSPPRRRIDSFQALAPRTDGVVSRDGILYWVDQYYTQCIVEFHPFKTDDGKRWRFISLPPELVHHPIALRRPSTCGHYCLGVWGDRLRASQGFQNTDGVRNELVLRVWELKDYKNDDAAAADSWCLIHTVRRQSKGRNYLLANFHPNNADVVFMYCNDNSIFQYNIMEKEMENVGQFTRNFSTFGELSVFTLLHPAWPTPISTRSSA